MESEVIVTEQELPPEVLQAIKNGRKIVAIKLLREATGLGLANAKVLVDRAAARHVERSPAPAIVQDENGVSKLLKMLLIVAFLYALYRFFLGA
jgi:ribosomal protein L7/L12